MRLFSLCTKYSLVHIHIASIQHSQIFLFSEFLGESLENDCFNINAFANYFWYIWASDGNNGFLLDMIKRPNTLELRLDLYNNT